MDVGKHDGNHRRDFLARCGAFAAVTPPALTVLLSTTLEAHATMSSCGTRTVFSGRGRGGCRSDVQPVSPGGKDTGRSMVAQAGGARPAPHDETEG